MTDLHVVLGRAGGDRRDRGSRALGARRCRMGGQMAPRAVEAAASSARARRATRTAGRCHRGPRDRLRATATPTPSAPVGDVPPPRTSATVSGLSVGLPQVP